MLNTIDNKIDVALTILANSKDCIESSLDLGKNKNIIILLVDRNLASKTNENEFAVVLPTYRISPKGLDIVKNGGWLKHLENEKIELTNRKKLEKLEFNLAQSNIEVNRLNKKNSKFNNRVNIINIIIGILNILVALGLGLWSYKVGLLK